jgi:hypothetical protein
MFNKVLLSCLAGGLTLASAASAAAALPAVRSVPAPAAITLKAMPLPRLANGRVDSNAVFARIAASRAAEVPLLARLDRYKLRALVLAVSRNDSLAIDKGLRELIALTRELNQTDLPAADIGELIMAICKAAAVEASADLAGIMQDMNAQRAQKEALRGEGLALLHARLAECDSKKPCAPPEGKPLRAEGVPADVIRPGVDLKQQRVDTLAAAVAMITANADRMDKLARSLIDNNKN